MLRHRLLAHGDFELGEEVIRETVLSSIVGIVGCFDRSRLLERFCPLRP